MSTDLTSQPGAAPRQAAPRSRAARRLWVGAGWVAVGLGAAGVVLPLVPTTPFLLLAVAAFGRGDPRLSAWLAEHPRFGPTITAWRRHRAIPRRAKRAAYATMGGCLALTAGLAAPVHVVAVQAGCLALAAAFIATRPDAPAA